MNESFLSRWEKVIKGGMMCPECQGTGRKDSYLKVRLQNEGRTRIIKDYIRCSACGGDGLLKPPKPQKDPP